MMVRRIALPEAEEETQARLTFGGRPSVYPWRTIEVGGEFRIPKPTKYAARDAAAYRRKYGLEFRCREVEGGETIVRRIK